MNPLRSRFSILLVINFLFVSAIALGTASLLNYHFTRRDLVRQTHVNLHNQSRELALLVGELLLEHVELLKTLATTNIVQDQLLVHNQAYEVDSNDRATAPLKPTQTQSNSTGENLRARSPFEGPLADELDNFVELFPNYSDVLIAGQTGTLIAATQPLEADDQSDKEWWTMISNDGQGAIYVSQPIFDETLQTYLTEIAVPVYRNGIVVGGIHGVYRLEHILMKVLETVTSETGGNRLYISDEHYLGENLILHDAPLPNQVIANQLQTPIDYGGRKSFVSTEPVHTITDTAKAEGHLANQAIAQLNWRILVYQSSQEALEVLADEAEIAISTAAIALLIAIILGIILAQIVSNPIQTLIRAAQKVQDDSVAIEDLNQLDTIATKGDDLGKLAAVFRDMALVIIEREKSLSDEIATLQAQVNTGNQQASGLELAYYEALRKKSAWLRQKINQGIIPETTPKV